jgi:hypothetical protein
MLGLWNKYNTVYDEYASPSALLMVESDAVERLRRRGGILILDFGDVSFHTEVPQTRPATLLDSLIEQLYSTLHTPHNIFAKTTRTPTAERIAEV